ncbi:MAG: alpha/beta hydrolase [Thaumarchaeota archaeon]|nr:alpha/beta hydrolase [Nitrososphaerota archaeon]
MNNHRSKGDPNYFRSFDGTSIYYEEFGSGKSIVLVHGWCGSHSLWERTVQDLAKKFRTFAMDNRGHGDSGKPNTDYDFNEFSSDLKELIDQKGLENAILVGWSMGVSISLRYFERFGKHGISKLVLVNGPIRLASAPDFPYSMSREYLENLFDERIDNRAMREREFVKIGFYMPHLEATNWISSIHMETPMHIAMKCVRHQMDLDMRDVLKKIDIPTLVCYGAHDPFYPTSLGQFIVQRIPNSRLVIFEESGHYPFLEESNKFSNLIEEFADS